MAYFDPTDPDDTDLLHADVRESDELAHTAARVEADVLQAFTERRSYGPVPADAVQLANTALYVYLDGYAASEASADGYAADRASWSGFADAMRRTIADVVSHRLRSSGTEPGIQSYGQGSRWTTYRGSFNPDWPRNWSWRLRPYDLRTNYAIG